MKKIPTIFIRDKNNMRNILDIRNPECLWVFQGEGVPTRKYDGTCCKIEKGKMYKRREVKSHQKMPDSFFKEGYDPNTEKYVGWVPVNHEDKQDKYHTEAFDGQPDGTYELVGPKVQGNPEGSDRHTLIAHSNAEVYEDCPRTFDELKAWLIDKDIEGIVFHHPDNRMAKIKKRDFNLKR